jgi:dolichyl-phosphate-mannose-protein mannosyltransferase
VLTLGVFVDLVARRFPAVVNGVGAVIVTACIVYAYWMYVPITFGESWTVASCEQAQLLNVWDFNCQRYAPMDSPERLNLFAQEHGSEDNRLFYGDEQEIYEEELPVPTASEDPEDEEYEEEEEEDWPTEAPVFEDPEPDFVDGKEVFGPDEDEDDYPRTMYGYEDDEEEVPVLATIRQIPVTKAND